MKRFAIDAKIAVITGGNRGIGFAIASGMAVAGATVIIVNRTAQTGQDAATRIQAMGGRVFAITADINALASIRAMVDEVVQTHDRIDILVNSAGTLVRKNALDLTEHEWDMMVNANMKGLFFCCQQVGKVMVNQGSGKIINIASVLYQIGQEGLAVYAATKAGVAHLTKTLAMEWIPKGVHVNAIAPTLAITDINQAYFDRHPAILQSFIKATPIGRVSTPEDYVGPALFLASSASDYVVGQTIMVDGGRSIP